MERVEGYNRETDISSVKTAERSGEMRFIEEEGTSEGEQEARKMIPREVAAIITVNGMVSMKSRQVLSRIYCL